tara:strand:+ start:501 stop:2993 length:2493 start_codon:yes stop_codon:yes gene_type:complete
MEFIKSVIYTLFTEELTVFVPTTLLFFYFFFYINHVQKNYYYKTLFFLIPIINIFYNYSYLTDYFSALGQDSFLEVDSNFGEAFFYLKNLFIFLFDFEIFSRNRFWLLLVSTFFSGIGLFFVFKLLKKKIKNINSQFYLIFFNRALYVTFFLIIAKSGFLFYENYSLGRELKKITNNSEKIFNKNIKNLKITKNLKDDLLVVTYIGESTSALNFSLYGYPFKTTPWLDTQKKNKKFMYFKNIFARYTHTTPSLIDTLSICKNSDINSCSLTNLENLDFFPLTKILEKKQINTHLFSTQGNLGGHNLANKIVLNTKNKVFSSSNINLKKGNRTVSQIKDKDFFLSTFCNDSKIFKKNNSDAVFLHSYAGHGYYDGYLGHLDTTEKISYPNYINPKNFLGKDEKNFNTVQEYDSAINYIDQTIKEVVECSIKKADKNNKPYIFIYFSDHGESPSTLRGHDSSRLTYEMLHVPFFIFFNDLAYEKYRDKFDFLAKLKNKNLSLQIVNNIFVYLFEIEISSKVDSKFNLKKDSFNNLETDFLTVRKKVSGEIISTPTFWFNRGKNDSPVEILGENILNNQDTSISLWQLNNYLKQKNLQDKKLIKNLVCQHRTNSFILQYKNSMSTGCFETDIFYLKEKTISAHGLNVDTNLVFEDFLRSKYKKNTVWMDSKNINKEENCRFALKWFKKNSKKFESILVELPTNSIKNSLSEGDWMNCIKEINLINNIEIAYYMDTKIIKECSNYLRSKDIKNYDSKCKLFYSKTKNFLKKIEVSSITFDYKDGKHAILNNAKFKDYKWHVWNVDNLSDFQNLISRNNIGIILLKNNKYLNNLN